MSTRMPPGQRFTDSGTEPGTTVLLLVDWINPLEHEGANALARSALAAAQVTARLKSRLVSMGVPCIYANDNGGLWRPDFRGLVSYCRQRGGASAAIADLLAPRGNDICVIKPGQSAFHETPLQLLLQQHAAREIVLAGITSDVCVLSSAMDAYERGYSVWAPQDCMASVSEEAHYSALRYMKDVLILKVDAAEPASLTGADSARRAAAPSGVAAGGQRR